MDARAKLKLTHQALLKARKAQDAWIKGVIAGKTPVNKARGRRLARDVERKVLALTVASRPFVDRH